MTAVPISGLIDAAFAWHEAGVCVLPAAPDGTKRPAVAWQRYQAERPDVVDLTNWLGPDTYDGIGIVCGAISGNLEMFELEAAAVALGLHIELRELFRVAGFPELWDKLQTYVERSPAGGLHWIYRVEGPIPGNTKLARRRVAGAVQVLMETRGEGGWVVIAPSGGRTHVSGKAWAVLPGSVPGRLPTLTIDEHRTLHRLAALFDEMTDVASAQTTGQLTAPARDPGEVPPGEAFAQQTDWADLLVPAGWRLIIHRGDGTRLWRRPGKNVGISATTGFGDQGHDLLYVFTTSTEFESERSYSKFGAYALLNHNGDLSGAARELRRKGFGTPQSPQERFNPLTLIQGEGEGVSEPLTLSQPAGDPTSLDEDPPVWDPVDLTEHLNGAFTPLLPELMARTDGVCLLYRGKVHSFHGESESGKSWLGLWAIAEVLNAGGCAAMIDFESDAHTIVGRLLSFGVAPEAIRERFQYRNPDVNPSALAREYEAFGRMLDQRYDVVLIDGVTDALAVFTVSSKDNDEVTGWLRSFPKRVAGATGAAVILIDHVTKDADTRGRFAIGGQSKMSGLDGAAYMVEVLEPMGIGMVGRLAMRVAKDRNGSIRPKSGPYRKGDRSQEAAVVTLDSSRTDILAVAVDPPRFEMPDEDGEKKGFRPTYYMAKVSRELEKANAAMTRSGLAKLCGRKDYVLQAIECLIEDEYASADGPSVGGHPAIRLLRPYREGGVVPEVDPTDLVSDDPGGVVPGSRAKDPGNQGTTHRRSAPVPGNHPEPLGNQSEIPLDLDEGDVL